MHNLQSCHAHKIAELQRYVLPWQGTTRRQRWRTRN